MNLDKIKEFTKNIVQLDNLSQKKKNTIICKFGLDDYYRIFNLVEWNKKFST